MYSVSGEYEATYQVKRTEDGDTHRVMMGGSEGLNLRNFNNNMETNGRDQTKLDTETEV